MKATLEKLAADALSLPINDRAVLAQALIRSLDEVPPADDPMEVQLAWEQEVERRVDDIVSGRVPGIPAKDVFAKLRAKYG